MRLLFLIAMMLPAGAAWAKKGCNNLQLQMFPAAYDLAGNTSPTFTVRVSRNNANNGCDFFISFDYGTASAASARHLDALIGGGTIPVQLYKDAGRTQILKRRQDATSASDVITGSFPDNSGPTFIDINYYATMDTAQYSRYGFYFQTFTATLHDGLLSDYDQKGSQGLTLTTNQQKKIDLSLVETGGPFNAADTTQTMDFGNISTGAVRNCDLVIGYNAGYQLTIASANSGRIKHATLADTIAYTFELGGTVISLASGSNTRPAVSGVSPAGGLRLPIKVTVTGSLTGKSSGLYKDTVTLSVVSTE